MWRLIRRQNTWKRVGFERFEMVAEIQARLFGSFDQNITIPANAVAPAASVKLLGVLGLIKQKRKLRC